MKTKELFGMDISGSLMEANDLGLINSRITLNGWMHDIAEIRGLFAPPFFCRNFRLEIRFDGQRVKADKCFWYSNELRRSGRFGGIFFSSRLLLMAGARGAVMAITLENRSESEKSVDVQYEFDGALSRQNHWEFIVPQGMNRSNPRLTDGVIVSDSVDGRIKLASSLKLEADAPGIFNCGNVVVPPRSRKVFYTAFAAGSAEEADAAVEACRCDMKKAIADAVKERRSREKRLLSVMPSFSSSCKALERLYYRSLQHLLLNEWNVPEWKLHPYYSTGSINGGCCCCYLWNYGEPYKLWSILDPDSAREHLLTFLGTDLSDGFAFYPDDGELFGPYYPVNQEKILLLAYAYVTASCDKAFLHSRCRGKKVIELLCEQALMHDDISREAVLTDYGNGNHHLELRRELRYDGTVPDLNLRRCINYHLCASLCRIAEVTPPVDMEQRAEKLKELIARKLYDPQKKWFNAIDPDGNIYTRYTIQMFKALGSGGQALTPGCAEGLKSHLNEEEFLGKFGMHSLSKKDPAYDPDDVDNGGPGACISFAPAVVERLYREGDTAMAWDIFRRLLWLADKLPYWGDSHTADRMEYRRDTPLQCDIQGAALAQTVIFGMFGISVDEKLSVSISPSLPEEVGNMELKNVNLAGKSFSVRAENGFFTVECDGNVYKSAVGDKIVLL